MANRLLQETAFALLQETGAYILLNEEPSARAFQSDIRVTRGNSNSIGVGQSHEMIAPVTQSVRSRVVIS